MPDIYLSAVWLLSYLSLIHIYVYKRQDIEYVAHYYKNDGIVPSDLSFNVVAESNKIYVVHPLHHTECFLLFRQGNDFILRRFFQQHNPSQLFLFDCENF